MHRLLIAVAIFVVSNSLIDAADRPNVLLIMADDLNNMLGCYGDQRAKTPNIDRLAARGMRFDRAYCQFPLCGPSRNAMLTGLYCNSTGIYGNGQIFRQTIPGHCSLPQAFRLDGYFAARVGKLYHYGVPGSIGTAGHDDPASWEWTMQPAGCDRLEEQPQIFSLQPGQFGGTLSWYASPKPDKYHTDSLQADAAELILDDCAKHKDRPFFVGVGFFRPHTPYVSPKKYFELYPKAEMPVVENVAEDQADIPAAGLASKKKEQDTMTDDTRRECRQAYLASISFMDAQVGRVLDALDRTGLADNTIIVFTSDHGYHMGEHGLWQKMSLFEESSRVPLIIVAPGVTKPNTAAKAPVAHLDLYPTLAQLCSVESPKNLQGQSLVPMLKDPAVEGRGWALTQVSRNARVGTKEAGKGVREPKRFFGYTLRTPRWRYTEWDEGRQGRELYDHDADPRELTNLAEKPEHADVVSELSEKIRTAASSSFPSSGSAPELKKEGLWYPSLTDADE